MRVRLGILLAAVFSIVPLSASGQSYPSRTITMLVPFPAGSGPDVYARLIGTKMAANLGQSVVIENRPGAGGAIGGRALARSEPDGYTIMFGSTSSVLIAPAIAKDTPYDPVQAFAPVIQVARGPFILSVRSGLPIHNLQEFIAYAKANPGKLNYGSSGIGSLHHLSTELLKHVAKINLTAHSVPGRRPVLDRSANGCGRSHLRQHAGADQLAPGRQGASHCRHRQQAAGLAGGCADDGCGPDLRRAGSARRRCSLLVRHRRPCRNTSRRRFAVECSGHRKHARFVGEGAVRAARYRGSNGHPGRVRGCDPERRGAVAKPCDGARPETEIGSGRQMKPGSSA